MQDERKKLLAERLERMQGNERNKLMKRAAKLRKANRRKEKEKRGGRQGDWDGDEDGEHARRRTRRSSDSLEDWALRLLEEEEAFAAEAGLGPESPLEAGAATESAFGTVLWVGAGRCRVVEHGHEHDCVLGADLARTQKSDLAVGDLVRFEPRPDGPARVAAVLPRRTRLSRPDPHDPRIERVIAANVDVVVVVASVRTPPLRPGLIDRFLIAGRRGGAEVLVAVNKLDLCATAAEREEELARLESHRRLGLEVLACSAATGEGVAALRERLRSRLCVLAGHSGVGKSSLLNALDPGLALRTGGLRESDGKGRHTTTASTLHELAGGIRVIDTPGIRSLGLWRVTPAELPACFPELAEHAGACRFDDCTHVHEPDCGVGRAADSDPHLADRLAAYRRLSSDL